MARKRIPSRLHLLLVREVQTAGDGDHSDGAGLLLRVRAESASWVLRYTAASGKRREMGLGVAHRNNAAVAGANLTDARDLASKARLQLQQGLDPIDERARLRVGTRQAATAAKAKQKVETLTLARAAREYHERVVEPSRTEKHGAQWISSLEHHVPPDLWAAPITSITAPQVPDFLIALRKRIPGTARRVRQRL